MYVHVSNGRVLHRHFVSSGRVLFSGFSAAEHAGRPQKARVHTRLKVVTQSRSAVRCLVIESREKLSEYLRDMFPPSQSLPGQNKRHNLRVLDFGSAAVSHSLSSSQDLHTLQW